MNLQIKNQSAKHRCGLLDANCILWDNLNECLRQMAHEIQPIYVVRYKLPLFSRITLLKSFRFNLVMAKTVSSANYHRKSSIIK